MHIQTNESDLGIQDINRCFDHLDSYSHLGQTFRALYSLLIENRTSDNVNVTSKVSFTRWRLSHIQGKCNYSYNVSSDIFRNYLVEHFLFNEPRLLYQVFNCTVSMSIIGQVVCTFSHEIHSFINITLACNSITPGSRRLLVGCQKLQEGRRCSEGLLLV